MSVLFELNMQMLSLELEIIPNEGAGAEEKV